MFAQQLAGAISHARSPQQCDQLARDIWRAHASGILSDDEAQAAAESIHAKKQAGSPTLAGGFKNASSAFPRARQQRSPDKQASIERRRRLAACWPLPPALASKFTTSEQAALRVIADEMRRYGSCAMFIDKVAAIAGTCRTVVKNTLRKARALRLLTVEERRRRGQRSLTNVVRFLCTAWRHWINRRKTGGIFSTTTVDGFKPEGEGRAVERFAQSLSVKKIASLVPRSP
jgi:hypothetical protein